MAIWRTIGVLTDTGKVRNWWWYGWRPRLTFGDAISSGKVSILDLQQVEVLPYIGFVQFSIDQIGFDHGITNANCGFFNVLKDFISIGGASMESVRAEGQESTKGKVVVFQGHKWLTMHERDLLVHVDMEEEEAHHHLHLPESCVHLLAQIQSKVAYKTHLN